MIYINFSAEINPNTSEPLMSFLADQLNKGQKEFYILLSCGGGSVKDGITLYNYIRALPAKFTMHNIGVVNSVANIIFLAADERYAVSSSSFLFHGVGFDILQPTRLELKDIRERMTTLEKDQKLISDIVLKRSKIEEKDLKEMFLEAAVKSPEQAKNLGLIQEIKEAKIPEGVQVFSFNFPQRPWR